ncbi:hypothetical protein IWX47DRAFT_180425 [Phyllosticta citricarpa]
MCVPALGSVCFPRLDLVFFFFFFFFFPSSSSPSLFSSVWIYKCCCAVPSPPCLGLPRLHRSPSLFVETPNDAMGREKMRVWSLFTPTSICRNQAAIVLPRPVAGFTQPSIARDSHAQRFCTWRRKEFFFLRKNKRKRKN